MPFFLCTSSVCFPFRRSLIWKCWWDDFPLPLSFLGFRHQKRMFSCREPYVFPGGNLRFPRGRHRKSREVCPDMSLQWKIFEVFSQILYEKITAFMVDWWFCFLRFRMFFRFLAFVQRNFVQDFSCFRCSLVPVRCASLPFLYYTCVHVRVHTPARNT